MKNYLSLLWIVGLIGLSGCAQPVSMGRQIHDTAQQAALRLGIHSAEAPEGTFRTLVCWGSRQMSFVEIVKKHAEGGLSVAAVTDLGNTLYAIQVDPNGEASVIRKSLPFSDQWLLDGLVAELLILWHRPPENSHLHQLNPEHQALVFQEGRSAQMYVFDRVGRWIEYQRLWRRRPQCRVSLEWDNDSNSLPRLMRVNNSRKHYRVVRERMRGLDRSSEPSPSGS